MRYRLAFLPAALALSLLLTGGVHAQTSALSDFNLPAQSLGDSLRAVGRQLDVNVLFDPARVERLKAPAIKLRGTFEEALSRLLAGSGFTYRFLNEHTVVLSDGSDVAGVSGGVSSNASEADRSRLAQSDPSRSMQMANDEGQKSAAQSRDRDAPDKTVENARGGLQEIVVTAQRREERLQDVPFAITAIGQREIRDRGAIDIKDLQYSIPGLNIQELQPGANRTVMRGINPGISTGLPVVAVYVDEVGINLEQQQRDGIFPLVDIDRIEVLRGPQGTLYGQGSIAGTIRYVTRNPDLQKSDGFLETHIYGQEDGGVGYRANGAVGVALAADRVGLRISGGYDHLAGWIDYPAAGVRNANDTERTFVRPKLLARLTDDLTLSLLYQYYDQKSDTDASSSVASPILRSGKMRLYPASDRSHLANAILSYDFGPATLMSSSGYQRRDLHFTAAVATFFSDNPGEYEQFSQELRVSSNPGSAIQYTAGAWYRKFSSNVNRILFDVNGNPTAVARKLGNDPADSESKAVFGDATVAATDRLDVSLGARYYWDTRDNDAAIPLQHSEADFASFSPRGSIRYSWTPEVSTYVTVSKGFRSGGFNNSGTSYGPESLWNYEIGTKALVGGALFIDLAGYYVDYQDRQSQTAIETSPGVFFPETRSVGKASGFGVEGALGIELGGGFRIDVTGAYNDVRSDVTNAEVLEGERFGFVPKVTGSVSLSQRVPLSPRLQGLWRIDYQHSSPYASIIRQGLANGSVLTVENYENQPQDYLNARLGVEIGQLGIFLDAQNILDEDAVLFPFSPIATTGEGVRARPRSYGLTVRRDFGR